jgi:hypothetical protein
MKPPRDDAELQALAAEFVAKHGVTMLPKSAASGPPIKPIRNRLRRGVPISIPRGRGAAKRKIVFKPAPTVVERIVQDEGEARQRRKHSGASLGTRNDRQRPG